MTTKCDPLETNRNDCSGPVEFLAAGDLHAGSIAPERLAALFGAAAENTGALFLAVPGDLTNDGHPEQYALLMRHVARLPIPFLGVMGNHDVHTGPDAEARARFCRAMGVEAPTYYRKADGATFLFLSIDGNVDGCTVAIERSLCTLEAVLGEGDGPLIAFCHAPLTGTIQGVPDRPCFLSDDPMFGLAGSDRVRALVRRAGRPVVWICGHTHTPVEAETLLTTERLDGAVLHSVNVSCPYFTGRDLQFDAPILLYHFRLEGAGLHVWIEDIGLRESVREKTLSWE